MSCPTATTCSPRGPIPVAGCRLAITTRSHRGAPLPTAPLYRRLETQGRPLHDLFDSPHATHLTQLILTNNTLDREDLRRLTSSPHLADLRTLFVPYTMLDVDALASLWRPDRRHLTTLCLDGNPLVGAERALASPGPPALTHLSLSGCALDLTTPPRHPDAALAHPPQRERQPHLGRALAIRPRPSATEYHAPDHELHRRPRCGLPERAPVLAHERLASRSVSERLRSLRSPHHPRSRTSPQHLARPSSASISPATGSATRAPRRSPPSAGSPRSENSI